MNTPGNNYFKIFSLEESFDLDIEKLTAEYKKLQAQSHPDRFSDADDGTRLRALQLSSILNEAFQTLKSPLQRAAYLLALNGVDAEEHSQAHLSESLLLQQMDWRDQLEVAAKEEDLNTLDRLKQEVKIEQQVCMEELRVILNEGRFSDAKPQYNRLQFVEKMLSEINRSEEKILDY